MVPFLRHLKILSNGFSLSLKMIYHRIYGKFSMNIWFKMLGQMSMKWTIKNRSATCAIWKEEIIRPSPRKTTQDFQRKRNGLLIIIIDSSATDLSYCSFNVVFWYGMGNEMFNLFEKSLKDGPFYNNTFARQGWLLQPGC